MSGTAGRMFFCQKGKPFDFLGTDGTYPPRWWSLETVVICWSQETGVNNAANELIKCREVGGDPESLGG